MNRTLKRLAIPAGAAAILATSGFAFMANNTFNTEDAAGQGQDTISGYTVSDVHYTYSSPDAQPPEADKITSVAFNLDKEASRVSAQIKDNSWHQYTNCVETSGTFRWTCTTPNGSSMANLGNVGGGSSAGTLSVAAAK